MNHMLPIGCNIASLNQSMMSHGLIKRRYVATNRGVTMNHLVADRLQCSVVYAFHDSLRSRLVDIKYPMVMLAIVLVITCT